MTLVPVMLIVWGALVLITAVLYLYRSRLTRDEDDQIYLDDAFSHEKAAQEAIAAKVNKIEPALKTMKWLVVLATVSLVAYGIYDAITQFK
jgi:hypothetical protein